MGSEQDKQQAMFDHLDWAIEHRSLNQRSALRLLRLLSDNEEKIKRHEYDQFAQDVVGVAFSLWRAAFLADKDTLREKSFKSALRFLEMVISDNAIGFPQDKKEKDWTFNFYTDNVRFTFLTWGRSERFKRIVPRWQTKKRNPRQRWEYCHKVLDKTIDNLESALLTLR
jgi:hypothetical protein